MAGSWQHMTTKSGKLRNNESFCDLVENPGDAYEVAEECYGMVWWLAGKIAADTGDRNRTSREEILNIVHQAQVNYKDGLRLGGVQKSR